MSPTMKSRSSPGPITRFSDGPPVVSSWTVSALAISHLPLVRGPIVVGAVPDRDSSAVAGFAGHSGHDRPPGCTEDLPRHRCDRLHRWPPRARAAGGRALRPRDEPLTGEAPRPPLGRPGGG